jgi:enterochelin esterase-like enzyme
MKTLALIFSLAALHAGQGYQTDFTKFKAGMPGPNNEGDYVIQPPFVNAPELTLQPSVPHGHLIEFVMDSTTSRIYPGIAKAQPLKLVPYHRRVTIYIPPGPFKSPLPFFVAQDSLGRGEIPVMLDNMLAAKRLPAMVGIFIDSGGDDSLGSERGLEYDTLSSRYADFIEEEVIPEVEKRGGVTLTKNPEGRMSMGGSSGAACAFSMAWYRTERYHRVLLYSGTFVNQQWPYDPATPHGAWEYHDHLIPETKRKPIRIWMEVGENDLRSQDPESTYHNWVMANNRFATVLKAKGYHYQYVFARNARHVDGGVVRQTLPEAFEFVWKGYRP